MSKPYSLLLLLATLACAGTTRQDEYAIRFLDADADGGPVIRIHEVEIALSVSPWTQQRRVVDVKATVRNGSRSRLTMTSAGAQLEAGSDFWQPTQWKAFWGDRVVADSVTVEPQMECGILCSFQWKGPRRGRFPKDLRLHLGDVRLEGRPLELGVIELYVPQ